MRVDRIFWLAEAINEGADFLLHNRKTLDWPIETVHGLGCAFEQAGFDGRIDDGRTRLHCVSIRRTPEGSDDATLCQGR